MNICVDRCASGVRALRVLCLLFLLSFTPLSVAMEGDYAATVAVVDQSPAEFERAAQEGLMQVLESMRLRGELVKDEAGLSQSATDYLLQFGYTGTASGVGYLLQLQFDPQALKAKVVRSAPEPPPVAPMPVEPAPVLGSSAERSVLLWLAVNDAATPYVLGQQARPDAANALIEQAAQAGVSLLIPQMDQVEQSTLDYYSVRAEQVGKVWQASSRYPASSVVYGTLEAYSGRWFTRWTRLVKGTVVSSWESEAGSASAVLTKALTELAEQLSPRAVRPQLSAGRRGYVLVVNNVRDFAQFKAVEQVVKRYVASASVAALSREQLEFDLDLNGLNTLRSSLLSEPQFRVLPTASQPQVLEVDYRP